MVVELLTPVATWALGKAADTVWTLATDKAQTTLQKTDVEQAIKAGLEAVRAWEQSLEVPALLFKRCDDKQKRQFLEQVFANAGVVEQLQRPLVGKGEPDVGLLQAYVEQVARDGGIELTTESLPQWLQIFSATYVEKTALFTKYEVARQRYLQQLAHWYDDVKFLGISVAGQEDTKSEKLLQIFVMPDVKQRAESWKQEQLSQQVSLKSRSGLILMVDDPELIVGHPQFKLMMEQHQLTLLLKQEGKPFSAEAIYQQGRSQRCVLLGAPGSGKTTLMSYFAVAFTTEETPVKLGLAGEHLPILVRIRDWVRSSHTNLLDYVRWFATDKLNVRDLPPGFFEHWLKAGKALILLDGLDEVASEARRDEVVNQIECFLQHEAYRQNPAIITSRPAGYKQAYFRTEEFPHYDLQPFDQPKIDQFIQNWYDNRFQDRDESQRRQQTLKQALSERDRIQVLAKNPLLLTTIALIDRGEAYLPHDRHELYNRAVETLLTNWDANKELNDYKWPLEYLKRDAVRRMMERLAYWIHNYGSTGDTEGGTLIDCEDLIRQLSLFIAKKAKIDREEATAEAKRFLEHIRSRTGLLNEQGQDCYAFVHKTFQEYLCAQEIQEQSADEDYDFDLILSPIRDHLHNPHWEEVLLLLIAQQREKRVGKILQKILDHPAPYEQWLHRNLFFAAACMAENVKLTDVNLTEHILAALVELVVAESSLISLRLKRQAEQCLRNLAKTEFQDLALPLLEVQHAKISPVQLQQFRAALGCEASATATLFMLLSNEDSSISMSAAKALSQLGKNIHDTLRRLCNINPQVIQVLLSKLSDEDLIASSVAAYALSQLGNANPDVVQAMLDCLKSGDRKTIAMAAHALGQLLSPSPSVAKALLSCFDDGDNDIRSSIAEPLGRLARVEPSVVQALLNRLKDEDSNVRYAAVCALGELGTTTPNMLQALVYCLDDKDRNVRISALFALGELGTSTADMLQALLHRLKETDWEVRSMTAYALGKLGNATPEVIQALLSCLSDDLEDVPSSAAIALGELGTDTSEVLQALISLLVDSDKYSRSSAVQALGQLGNTNTSVIQTLIGCLSDDDSDVRSSAVAALGRLARPSPEVVSELIDRLSDDESGVRSRAASALGKLGRQTDVVAPHLADWIEQNQHADYVGHGIDALWAIMTEQS
ncbi:sister chromatid cohesion protein PDS5 [Nodosilinea sp. AN01ver1]|uniref:sister chromatid cohesion protein PDS5 n=1 Tax=Nodosilinea sp. AN01ver1 TaxID=3423362 RepID=UPI003D321D14